MHNASAKLRRRTHLISCVDNVRKFPNVTGFGTNSYRTKEFTNIPTSHIGQIDSWRCLGKVKNRKPTDLIARHLSFHIQYRMVPPKRVYYSHTLGSSINRLAPFCAHSSFCLDLRWFWLFMLTLIRMCVLTDEYLFFFPLFTLISQEYMLTISNARCKNDKKGCNYAHVEKNCSKSRNLSNKHLFVLFGGYR